MSAPLSLRLINISVQLGDKGPPIGELTRGDRLERNHLVGGIVKPGFGIDDRRTVIAPAANFARASASTTAGV